jgi:hypothetical protein
MIIYFNLLLLKNQSPPCGEPFGKRAYFFVFKGLNTNFTSDIQVCQNLQNVALN